MVVKEHERAAGKLDGIGDKHHLAFGHGVGEGADEGGEHHVRHGEEEFQ